MNVGSFAVNRPVAVVMRIAALLLLGLVCLTKLPVDLLPNVSIPTLAVVTTWPNVAPEEIETQVTRPIEEAVSAVNGLYLISSTTDEGQSVVRVQFNWGVDIGQAAVDTLQLVERAQHNFPSDPTLQMPTVYKFDPTQLPILIFGVTGIKDSVKLRTLMDNQITPIIESANGVASAVSTGGEDRSIIIDVDPIRLQAHHLVLNNVMSRIVAENINLPAGIGKQGKTEYTIRSLGWFVSPEEIANTPVGTFNGQTVLFRDVADVKDSHPEIRLYTRLNKEPCVGLIISKQSGVNTVDTAQAVLAKIESVKKVYPELNFKMAYDQSVFISDSVNDVKTSALIGGILAVLILLFFLRNIRSTLVVALSIPTSIISTFVLLYAFGFTLNTMSLGGLALATGLIVDDAVVVMENIFRHIERDKKGSFQGAIDGTNEILSAVVASTWTVMVVFLPLFLIKGQAGEMFTQFALVVIFSLAVSLLDAVTVVPMLSHRLISGEAHAELMASAKTHPSVLIRMFHKFGEWFNALETTYSHALKWSIHHRFFVIAGAFGMTVLVVGGFMILPALGITQPLIGTEMLPQTDSGDFTVTIKLPVGTSLSVTDGVMKRAEGIVLDNPNVETAFAASGTTLSLRGTSTVLTPYEGSITVKLKDNRKESTQQAIADLRGKLGRIPGSRPLLTQFDIVSTLMTGGNLNVEVDIFGQDLATLSRLGSQLMAKMRPIPGLENVDVNWVESMPEIQWKVDRQKAQTLGVAFTDVASTIFNATGQDLPSYYQEGGYQYPIVVQFPEDSRKTIDQLETMVVSPTYPTNNEPILLEQVATPTIGAGPSEITRISRQRYIGITGMPMGRSTGDVQKDIGKALAGMQFPHGYYWDWGINQKMQADEFGGLWLAILLAIGLIYTLLASQFESFVHPLTILLSVPLAATGVVLGLFLTGRSFGLTAFIGVLMLVGICVKNGILLVDYTNHLRREGLSREDALLRAGPTRMRPILMTASAAILGMFPLALALGRGQEVQAPMATAVIGGLTTSTLLTLLVVPAVYSALDDLAQRWQSKKAEKAGEQGG